MDRFYEDETDYNKLEYKGVTVFVLNTLKIEENARVFIQIKLPFVPPVIKFEGIGY